MTTEQHLHSTYCRLSGLALTWTMSRRFEWERWLAFRTPPFTEADLVLVIGWLRREIKAERRNAGAIRFHNITDPERFEEDLAEAMALARRPRPTARDRILEQAGRKPDDTQDQSRKAAEVLASPAFQAFVKLKQTL